VAFTRYDGRGDEVLGALMEEFFSKRSFPSRGRWTTVADRVVGVRS
jgi:hypothetical protein